jgi:broad specificity phosphatase PhoE
MNNIIIRHPSPEYTSNLYQDYLDNGLMQKDFYLSEKSHQYLSENLTKLGSLNLQKVLYSPATVCQQTAQIISDNLKIEKFELSELNIVKHDFSTFTDSQLWIDGKQPDDSEMQRLRGNSIIYFLEDKLSEPKSDILQRFERLKEILVTEKSCLFISHGYTIKLFYLYLKTDFKVSKEELVTLSETDKSFGESLQGFDYPTLNTVKI